MKKWILLALLCAALALPGCKNEPAPEPSQSEPQQTDAVLPETKTVYVIASITTVSGERQTRIERVFDENDRVTAMLTYTNGELTQEQAVECDENGNYIRLTCQGLTVEHTYDEHGHHTGIYTYADGELTISTEYQWENGLRTAVTDTMQGMVQKTVLIYDGQSRPIREDHYVNGALSAYSVYAYADDGSAQITTYDAGGSVTQTASQVWEGNTVTTAVYAADGNISVYQTQTYDDQGNLLTTQQTDDEGTVLQSQTYEWRAIEVPYETPRASN